MTGLVRAFIAQLIPAAVQLAVGSLRRLARRRSGEARGK